jgi:uncharacterized protein
VQDGGATRELPQLFLGLLAIALALGIGVPVTAAVVMDGIRDIKGKRDTIAVTGSAKYPIEANLAQWTLTVSSEQRTTEAAARALSRRARAVRSFLRDGGLADDVREPPLSVEQTFRRVPTGLKKPAFREVPTWTISQRFDITTRNIAALDQTASGVEELLFQGIPVAVGEVQYLSTHLKTAKYAALRRAVRDAHDRAETIAQGLGGDLGAVRNVSLGVYQITPRNSTDVSNEGINDVSSREKDVQAVVTVTFGVER